MTLTLVDWLVIGGYFALNLAIGLYYARRARGSTTEFFLSGRNVPWWLAGTSMVATTFAADTPLVVTGHGGPTAADVASSIGADDPGRAIARLCTDPPDVELTDALIGRLSRVLERLAPTLPRELAATCPECGSAISAEQIFVLTQRASASPAHLSSVTVA